MQAYQCDDNGIYIGMSNCQPSPLQPGVFLTPGKATLTAPPTYNPATEAAQLNFSTQTWSVVPLPPVSLAYGSGAFSFTHGISITPVAPSVSGGAVSSYSVSPSLPAGLSIDPVTGILSGNPSGASSVAAYVVQASNSSGFCTAAISIVVG